MILTEKTYDGVVSNINKNQSWQFMMEANAKAFETLSSTLYQDKIGSIVRELSCNALDSHIEAGNADTPFSIHLPSVFEPYFSVKDYGIGMDEDTVKRVFTVLFASTKEQSNDTVGAFGLGAKTPFSYTETFTVVSRKDGTETSYAMHKDEDGLPCCSKIGSKQTTEQNGVEIILPVNDQYDRSNFKTAIQNQLKFFKVHPTVVGGDYGGFVWENHPTNLTSEHNRVKIYSDANNVYSGIYAVMGPVGYQINFELLIKRFPKHATLLSHLRNQYGIFIRVDFDIGEVSVTPSRETLSYDEKRTFPAFEKALDGLYESMVKSFHDSMATCSTVEERKNYLKTNYNNIRNLVGRVDLSSYDFGIWEVNFYGRITFYISSQKLTDELNTPVSFTNTYRYGKSATNSFNDEDFPVIIIDNCKFIKRRLQNVPSGTGLITIDYEKIDDLRALFNTHRIGFKLLSEFEPVKSEKNYSYLTTEGYRVDVTRRVFNQLLRDMSGAKRITDKADIEPGYYLSSHRGNIHAIAKLEKYTLYKAAGIIKDDVTFIHVFPEKSAAKLKDDDEWSDFEKYLDTFDYQKLYNDNLAFSKYYQVVDGIRSAASASIASFYYNHYDINGHISNIEEELIKHFGATNVAGTIKDSGAWKVIYGECFRLLQYELRATMIKVNEKLHTNYPLLRSINSYYLTNDLPGLKEYIEMIDEKNGDKIDITDVLNFDAVKQFIT